MAFFERFRVELRKYAGGVHELGTPIDKELLATLSLPPGLSDFLRSWDGARLFQDTVVLVPLAAQTAAVGDGVRIGEWQEGTLELGADGRVRSRGDDGSAIVVGSTLERFLAAVMAREGLLVDREGEFKDVFDDEGVEDKVQARQTAAALKIDPEAAAWHLEVAERAFADGDEVAAEAALARVVALDGGAGDAWALLGALQRRAQRLDAAEASFARAAAATGDPATRAERAAEAARAAAESGREPARVEHAATATAADAGAAGRWIEEAGEQLREGDAEGAFNRATLAAAVDPAAAAEVVKAARVRDKLKTVR
jgi:tetratricopeptide (TPR) repeat protein